MTMKRGGVTLDGAVVFAATWDATDTWNGFIVPRFTRAEAERIATWLNGEAEGPEDTRAWWDGEVLVVREGDDATPDRYGPGMYAIGAGAWTWSEAGGSAHPEVEADVTRHWHALAHVPGERFVPMEEAATYGSAGEAWRHVAADLDAGRDQDLRFARTRVERDAVDARYLDARTEAHHGSKCGGAVTVPGDENGSPALRWRVWPCLADHEA